MRIISISLYNSSPHCAPYLNRPILRLQLANHLIILPHGFADFVHLVSHHVRHVLLHRQRVHFVLSANATLIHERLTPCIGLDHLIESGALSVRANAHDRIAVLFRLPGDFPPLRADDKCETDEEDGNGEGEGGGEMVEQQLAHRRRVVDLLYARLPREPQHGEDDGSLHADAEAALRALEGVVAQTLPGIEDELRETLNAPCLGQIPAVKISRKRPYPLLHRYRSESGFSESVRLLRLRVEKAMQENGQKILLVSSAIPGEGKTTVSVNLAVSLAQKGRRVLLIDCDFRNPSVAKTLSSKSHPLDEGRWHRQRMWKACS